jgi:long-subunit fatty acid transport protein
MIFRAYCLTLLLALKVFPAVAQKDIDVRKQTWFAYFNQTRFTERSGMWVDLQWRLNEVVDQNSVSISRLGYTYFLSDNVRLTAAYGYITHFALNDESPNIPEHRPWQQIQWFDKKENLSMMQYFRVEERFVRQVSNGELTDEDRFSWRFRYNFFLSFPLKGAPGEPRSPFAFINDEILISAGKKVVNNYFDQNRFAVGLGYQFTAGLNAQLGYLFVFQQLAAANEYVHINGLRLSVIHNLDLRK